MPTNKFPDTRAKRELRRQIRRRIEYFRRTNQLTLGLSYCGMPSIEFLDVIEWSPLLRSVCAVEIDDSNLLDMQIQWNTLSLNLPIRFVKADILDFLETTNDVFDLYNLDFYGGFVNPNNLGTSRCVEAIKTLIIRHSRKQTSFVLVATFNARDKGAGQYSGFIEEVPRALEGWENVTESCKVHNKKNTTRLKLCFPYFCWQYGMTNNFSVNFADPIIYRSSATMSNFYVEFLYQPSVLPAPLDPEVLATIANRPLMRLDDRMIESIEMSPPQITKSS